MPAMTVKRSELLDALSLSLDLIMGQRSGHCRRTGRIAVLVAQELRMSEDDQTAVFHAALLKDSGCSAVRGAYYQVLRGDEIKFISDGTAENESSLADFVRELASLVAPEANPIERATRIMGALYNIPKKHVSLIGTRVERGASIAGKLGFPAKTQDAVRCYFERWDGKGAPRRMRGGIIPPLAQLLSLAMCAEVLSTKYDTDSACEIMGKRRQEWFDGAFVDAFLKLSADTSFWRKVEEGGGEGFDWEPAGDDVELALDDERLRNIASVFADVVDSKSEFTASHSEEVSFVAEGIARTMGLTDDLVQQIRVAALLHDIGKLSVPNSILDKPGKLTDEQWDVVRNHPAHTQSILGTIGAFEDVAHMAGDHHERPDGAGYPNGKSRGDLDVGGRVIAVADVYQALKADRPYREGLEESRVMEMLSESAGSGLDSDAINALRKLF